MEVPEGADSIACDSATCATICKPGFKAMGQRRIRCRWNKNKGFFWKRELGTCVTCEEPTMSYPNVEFTCTVSAAKNQRVCTGSCPDGAGGPDGRKAKVMRAKCKCPKRTGVCGWTFKNTLSCD